MPIVKPFHHYSCSSVEFLLVEQARNEMGDNMESGLLLVGWLPQKLNNNFDNQNYYSQSRIQDSFHDRWIRERKRENNSFFALNNKKILKVYTYIKISIYTNSFIFILKQLITNKLRIQAFYLFFLKEQYSGPKKCKIGVYNHLGFLCVFRKDHCSTLSNL